MALDRELHDRIIQLARNLLEATKEGRITWATTDREQKFLYAGSRSSVAIELMRDRDGDEIAVLSLLNSKGTTVDSISSEFDQEATVTGRSWVPASWNDLLEDLYYAARRVAYNVDEAIEGMLEDIERGTPSPTPPPKKPAADDPWAKSSDGFSDEPPF